jgi:VWFA-related protein
MSAYLRVCLLVAASFASVATAQQPVAQQPPVQQPSAAQAPDPHSIHIDVAVNSTSGKAATGLSQDEFTLMDNKATLPLSSFKAISLGQEPAEVILLIDGVNTPYSTVAYEMSELQRFLKANPKLPHPTTIAVLKDKGAEIQKGFSTDGNLLSKLLDGYSPGLRILGRTTGFWGATERLDISLTAARELTTYAATLPGRKILIWISPGWPLLSGPRIEMDGNEQKKLFNDVVEFSTALRQARVTLYNINPHGVGEPLLRADYYQEFTKGVRRPKDTQIGNLGLQVLAVQSGGLTIETDNDIAESLQRCMAETESWYEISFPIPPAEGPNEYHHLEVKLNKPGLSARTRDGYYAQPEARP